MTIARNAYPACGEDQASSAKETLPGSSFGRPISSGVRRPSVNTYRNQFLLRSSGVFKAFVASALDGSGFRYVHATARANITEVLEKVFFNDIVRQIIRNDHVDQGRFVLQLRLDKERLNGASNAKEESKNVRLLWMLCV
jgi:hypothetical protein